jgi:putative N6-adenine-specific DNA methylase
MANWSTPAEIVIACARGLAPYAAQEAAALGFGTVSATDTMVAVRGTLADCMLLNLRLRTAHRVLFPVAAGRCRDLDALHAAVRAAAWEEWLDPDGYFTVSAAVWNDTVRDTRLPALRTKDAVADRLRQVCGRRPDAGPEFRGAAIFVYWRGDDLRVYLDTTGEPLSKRGYRKLPWKAPMQETLAAACVLATGWDGATPFVVPMCGSGTPAIEAALIARRRAPGLFRDRFAFMALRGYAAALWQVLRNEAREDERGEGLPPIVATDLDPAAVEVARRNAAAAGVGDLIRFAACDFADTEVPPPPGTIFLNPEYGERLGDAAQLAPLYRRIGDFLKQRGAGYRGFVLTGNLELSRRIGLRSSRRIAFFNGPIECRLVGFDLYPGTQRQRKLEAPDDP